ncbi:hypothetical protein [Nocardia sp. NBC_00416]|uniref:hypothetical protein n=1 Tax=Nocardia sp. NBC_00416 TaxID=2975991 RepID=UPI003FA58038
MSSAYRPVVVDFVVSNDALVWPMIAAGASNNHIMAARGIRPLFDDEDEHQVIRPLPRTAR